MLEGVITRKMAVNDANADQISFIINLMHGYDEWRLDGIREVKSEFLHNTTLTKAKKVSLDAKKIQKKRNKKPLSKKY